MMVACAFGARALASTQRMAAGGPERRSPPTARGRSDAAGRHWSWMGRVWREPGVSGGRACADESVHVSCAIVSIRLVSVVARAVEGQVLARGGPSPPHRYPVMELQLVAGATAAAVQSNECAAALVPLPNPAPNIDRNVSRRRFVSARPNRFQAGTRRIGGRPRGTLRSHCRVHFQPGSGLVHLR